MNTGNLKELLVSLNFTEEKAVFSKKTGPYETVLSIDFAAQQIEYPKSLRVNERQTCNFSSSENFVVFECVHRLLEKGYKPEHIELEPKWKLGHGASGGRADILVRNHQGQAFLIIECKTYGREFKRAWKDTLDDGGQLFSYVEQEKSVEFVCLYASQWNEDSKQTDAEQRIISVKDNPAVLKDLLEAPSYLSANNVKERFKVWKNTYQLEFTEKGIFEENIQAYVIGKDKYTLLIDTKPIDSLDIKGKYHEFRTILRKHNVSRRENAFEVLVNLFLCKIVDELQNPEDLKFYWKGIAYDSYFDLVDRLQELYKTGMQQFLKQDIVYISNKEIDDAFWAIPQKTNATKLRIQEIFRELKFYKGLDFEFIKVFNKQYFDKNAKILLDVIQMWQGLRLTSSEHNQFLGDMFEYFLDNGVKQSEGQFFTPLPICKFIVSALPLEQMLQSRIEPLKVIDYACGSGHFLTEYTQQIQKLLKKVKGIEDASGYYAQTFGIEKEDRLAKVAKVSAFMYGRNEIEIIDADALVSHPNIKEESFDALIANPPFAVEDFLQTIDEPEREKFQLYDCVSNLSTNNIQSFFIERAKHLLKGGSVIGVILPPSVLTNTDSVSTGAREILLQYFDFISIVELSSQTFGKTGTTTVILFLRRKAQRPEQAQHFKHRTAQFFHAWEDEKQQNGGVYADVHWVKEYCQHIDADYGQYESLLKNEWNETLMQSAVFADYVSHFHKQSDKRTKKAKAKTADDQQRLQEQKLLAYVRECEQEKMYYFLLAAHNAQHENAARPVLVVKSPSDNKEEKKFLGYEWVGRKGSEGVKYNGGPTIYDIQTPLFDPNDRENADKISYLIRQNFNGEKLLIPDALQAYTSKVYLTDLLDFGRKEFVKVFNLSAKSATTLETRYPLVKLQEIAICSGGSGFPAKFQGGTDRSLIPFYKVSDMNADGNDQFMTAANHYVAEEVLRNEIKAQIFEKNTLIFPKVGMSIHTNKKRLLTQPAAVDNNIMAVRVKDPEQLKAEYLYLYFNAFVDLKEIASSSNPPSISAQNLMQLKVALPPLDAQQEIVRLSSEMDAEAHQLKLSKEQLQHQIANKISAFSQYPLHKLEHLADNWDAKRKPVTASDRSEGEYPYYGASGIVDYIDSYLFEDTVLLISEDGANLKSRNTPIAFTASGKIWVNNHAHILKFDSIYMHKLVEFYLNSIDLTEFITGMAQPKLSQANLNRIMIPVPPQSELQQVIEQLQALEEQLAAIQLTLDGLPERKLQLLQRFL